LRKGSLLEKQITANTNIEDHLKERFGPAIIAEQKTIDDIPTLWVERTRILNLLSYLKNGIERPYKMLYDLSAIDERLRIHRESQPESDFTLVYHLLSIDRNDDIRIKVALQGKYPSIDTVSDIWESANWYEREAWDMFGINFNGHPDLRRILMPPTWEGHPLRKEHPARATDMAPFTLPDSKQEKEQNAMQFHPEDWGLKQRGPDTEFLFLNMGPQHPGTHGVLRLVLQLDAEQIVDVMPDIGFHHRGCEKMGERQSWHTYIPYTDRVDYLGGVLNNFPYVMAVEELAGIEIPDRAKVIRIMMAEFYRLANHLVFYGTLAQDVGALSPVFYMFNDRERIFDITEAICGGRMHAQWFRIGGVADDLPRGWDGMVKDFLAYMRPRMDQYDKLVMQNRIFKDRTVGIGAFTTEEAIDWGATGPMLRSTGLAWDFRKRRPYSGYDQFEFEIPTGKRGDCYDRAVVHVEEMRQSMRIIEQCLNNMPEGDYKSDHPRATPPRKPRTMHDIETLIDHFLNVSWGPVIPPGEAVATVEGTKGANGYYLISDGNTMSYRTRIRTPSFPHMQMIPLMSRWHSVSDMLAILGSIDFVLSDVDR
jgi:NADH-quinone oxidoreductase subunit C/D